MYNIRLVSKFEYGFFQERSRGVKIDVILKGEMLIMFPTHITHTRLMLRACLIVFMFVSSKHTELTLFPVLRNRHFRSMIVTLTSDFKSKVTGIVRWRFTKNERYSKRMGNINGWVKNILIFYSFSYFSLFFI